MSRMKEVYDYLVEEIVSNKILPGTPIIETDIANELNMSRTPIREALKELESEGLIQRFPGRGVVVSKIAAQDIEEIFTLRITLELLALELSFDKITTNDISEVEEYLFNLDDKNEKQDYYHVDKWIHTLIITKAGNRRLKKYIDLLNSQIERFRRISALEPNRLSKSKNEHIELIEAIKTKNFDLSSELLEKHLLNVKNSTLEVAENLKMQNPM
ncbi:MAG TPA: GntR family transcriptional regulator [Virgibacillus sp.]|nr:GntR family transcriptional regulator [Virgibacillus sp.]HLR65987.1 GntR family transcriptional regulator [Virgibacillus sp.]